MGLLIGIISNYRWSILNELSYHDPVGNNVVEPMHNLLLGKVHALSFTPMTIY